MRSGPSGFMLDHTEGVFGAIRSFAGVKGVPLPRSHA